MPGCEFSEDEYESFLIHELRYVYGTGDLHYKPTRPQEFWIGYDFGVRTSYLLFPHAGLKVGDPRLKKQIPIKERWEMPVRHANAFVQCKVPFYVTRKHNKTKDRWALWNRPYYSINIDKLQCDKLVLTSNACKGFATVCYATPCFWKYSDCDTFVPTEEIVNQTHFQIPEAILNGQHEVYTYLEPDGIGYGFSEPEKIASFSFFDSLANQISTSGELPIFEHINNLWELLSQLSNELPELSITDVDRNAAKRVAGEYASHVFILSDERIVTFTEVLSMVFRIRHFSRLVLNSSWLSYVEIS